MQTTLQILLLAATFAVPATAQPPVVTPADSATAPGGVSLPFSFGTGTRWQQVHGDLVGAPAVFTGLRLRRDDLVPPLPNAFTRAIDVEVWLGETDLSLVTGDFAQNFLLPPVQVLPPSTILLPDWTTSGAGFDLDLPFVFPYAYSGALALVVEVRILADTDVSHICDAFGEPKAQLPAVDVGVGCTTGILPFTQNSALQTGQALSGQVEVEWSLRALFAPPGSFGFFVVGATAQPLSLPGLCAPLVPSVDATVIGDTIDAGVISLLVAPRVAFTLSPGFVGSSLYTQAVAIEAVPAGLQFVLSQPQRLTVAAPPPAARPIVSLEGTIAAPLANTISFGGRVLSLDR